MEISPFKNVLYRCSATEDDCSAQENQVVVVCAWSLLPGLCQAVSK